MCIMQPQARATHDSHRELAMMTRIVSAYHRNAAGDVYLRSWETGDIELVIYNNY